MNFFKMILLIMVLVVGVNAQDKMPKKLEREAIEIINTFIKIMQNNSYDASAKMVVPLMHKSLLKRSQKALDSDTYRYSFKKAQSNAKNYTYPIKITRIQKLRTTEIGYGDTHEKGTEYKLWIAKKDLIGGVPAPLVIFFKDGIGIAKLSYVGSL